VPLNKPSCSFVAIEDAYKVKAGIAPVLSYKICEYCRKMGYKKIRNWIDVNNKESIEYHNMIGAKWGNRYLEYLVYEV
jgi:L-amino acid N-acyltransferase YncA